MAYYYGSPDNLPTWKDVVSIFAATHSLHSEKTSTLPLVQFWNPNDNGLEDVLVKACNLNITKKALREAKFCFEYPVPVHPKCGGRGKASMTDLMIITAEKAIAVEAKWTECDESTQTIKNWLAAKSKKRDGETNRKEVLKGWIRYIEQHLGNGVISFDKIANSEVPYQMLHRIASACHVAQKSKEQKSKEAVVIYQLFYDVDTENAMNRFASLLAAAYAKLFGGAKLEHFYFYIVRTKVEKREGFEGIKTKCKKEQDQYDWNAIFLEMQKSPIYTFSDIKLFPFDQK